ncbi:MAG: PqqD family protein [Acidobacteriota bacterium]|nr:MAG: PqqD family protein [Acidobacteriota bacterium]
MSEKVRSAGQMTPESVPKKGPLTASRVMDGEAVVFLPGKGQVRILNKLGTAVWELVDGERTVSEIVEEICKKYDVEHEVAERDALEFLKTLQDKELVECP